MTQPLALLFYENLMPGTQLVNRLQDLGYRVSVALEANSIVQRAAAEKAMVVIMDLACHKADVFSVIVDLKKNPATQHIPILAFARKAEKKLQEKGRLSGATLVAVEDAVLTHLPQMLDQVLAVE